MSNNQLQGDKLTDEFEDENEYDQMTRRTGCHQQHLDLQNCYFEKKDWRKCQFHVLVSPRRLVRRFHELTQNEVCDLWSTAQKVSNLIEKEYDGTSLSLVIQDGPDAGQTVPHVHIHVMPRHKGDFKINDQIYDELNKSRLDNDFRTPRSQSEMAQESESLRKLLYPDGCIPEELKCDNLDS
ncbi:hypothetical protein DSO57_1028543 [Entomophthora muscae]|uniref:Uncharacterized protein n=1 Tax=Entomophthora muscae TaxID=34485 RepID=A0ACC2TCM3_9FUNG|nr:hypothetical protein DSO57_1028543 [Entomophthora muscae]